MQSIYFNCVQTRSPNRCNEVSSVLFHLGKAVAGNNFIHKQQRHKTTKCVHAIWTSWVEQEQENHVMWLTELMMENDKALTYAGPPQPSAKTAMAKNAMAEASS